MGNNEKINSEPLTEDVSHWCLHMAITSQIPRDIILISEITLSKKCIFIALHLIFKSKGEYRKEELWNGGVGGHSATNVNYFNSNLKTILEWQSKPLTRKKGFISLKRKFKKRSFF